MFVSVFSSFLFFSLWVMSEGGLLLTFLVFDWICCWVVCMSFDFLYLDGDSVDERKKLRTLGCFCFGWCRLISTYFFPMIVWVLLLICVDASFLVFVFPFFFCSFLFDVCSLIWVSTYISKIMNLGAESWFFWVKNRSLWKKSTNLT